jgi:hypothetical protein
MAEGNRNVSLISMLLLRAAICPRSERAARRVGLAFMPLPSG